MYSGALAEDEAIEDAAEAYSGAFTDEGAYAGTWTEVATGACGCPSPRDGLVQAMPRKLEGGKHAPIWVTGAAEAASKKLAVVEETWSVVSSARLAGRRKSWRVSSRP